MSRSKRGHAKKNRHRKDNGSRHSKQRSSHIPPMLTHENQLDLQYMFDFRTELCSNPRCEKTRETCWNSHGRKPHRRIPRIVGGCFNYIPEPCQSHKQTTHCDAGDKCSKAHGWLEIIFHPLLYKTKLCEHPRENGVCCGYGAHCAKAHNPTEIRNLVELFGADWKKHYHFQPPSLRPDFSNSNTNKTRKNASSSGRSDRGSSTTSAASARSTSNQRRQQSQSGPRQQSNRKADSRTRRQQQQPQQSARVGSYSEALREASSSSGKGSNADVGSGGPPSVEEKEAVAATPPLSYPRSQSLRLRSPNALFPRNGISPSVLPQEFMWLYTFKTIPCQKVGCNTTVCENFHSLLDRRRSLKMGEYSSTPCPQAFVNGRWMPSRCPNGDSCGFGHSSYEVHYHPSQWPRFVALRTPKPGSHTTSSASNTASHHPNLQKLPGGGSGGSAGRHDVNNNHKEDEFPPLSTGDGVGDGNSRRVVVGRSLSDPVRGSGGAGASYYPVVSPTRNGFGNGTMMSGATTAGTSATFGLNPRAASWNGLRSAAAGGAVMGTHVQSAGVVQRGPIVASSPVVQRVFEVEDVHYSDADMYESSHQHHGGYSSNHGSNVTTTNYDNGDTTTSVGHLSDQDLEDTDGPPQAVTLAMESLGIEFDDEQLKSDLNSNIHSYLDDFDNVHSSPFKSSHHDGMDWGTPGKSLEDVFRPTDRDSSTSRSSRSPLDHQWVDWTNNQSDPPTKSSNEAFFYSSTRVPLCTHCEANLKNECFVPCGHTVCSNCRQRFLWSCCPQCGTEIQQFQPFLLN